MKYPFITVIGNIASGKSTLSSLLAQKLDAHLVKADELYKSNPFFQDAVVDRSRWSLASDIWFLLKRMEMAKKIGDELRQSPVVQDSGLLMSWAYANSRLSTGQMNLKETQLYNEISTILHINLPKEDLVIYLDVPIPLLQDRIKERGREYEIKYFNTKYLEGLHESLKKQSLLLQKNKYKLLTVSHTDLFTPTQMSLLIKNIKKNLQYDR